VPDDPFAWYRRLSENDPVHYQASAGIWFLTRYADVKHVLHGYGFSAALGQRLRRRGSPLPLSMLNSDPPDHGRLRAPAARVFAARAVERRRHGIRAVVNALLLELDDRDELDLLAEFARPLSFRILAELLDVPVGEWKVFERLADEASANLDPLAGPEALEAALEAAQALRAAFSTYLETPQSTSELGILDALGADCARAGLSRDELLTTLNLLVIGGYEPLANLVANALAALLADPTQLSVLRSDPSVIGTAVEELLRYDPPVPVAARAPRENIRIGGKDIDAAEPVVLFLTAANHDPAVFADPERLDLRRLPNPHLAFGAGAHFCLGAPLARLVCREALLAVLDRFPNLSVSGAVEWRPSLVPRGLRALPVRTA
jgi:cytochrome P450 PksS